METNETYLGVSGKVNHTPALTKDYNDLFEILGESGMLTQFERFIDEEELVELIQFIKHNLKENN
jgi:hypothetical protein